MENTPKYTASYERPEGVEILRLDSGAIVWENIADALKNTDNEQNRNGALKELYAIIYKNKELTIKEVEEKLLEAGLTKKEFDKILEKINNKHLIHAKSGLKVFEEKFNIYELDKKTQEYYFTLKTKLGGIVSLEEEKKYFENLNSEQILGRVNVASIQANYTN